MDVKKAGELIGKPYDDRHFHCWHLVTELAPKAYRLEIPASLTASVKYFSDERYWKDFEIVDTPTDGDIIMLGRDEGFFYHAGVYYQGGMIHATIPSVMYTPLDKILAKYPAVRYYHAKD